MTNLEIELKEAKEDALRYRTQLEEERSARASLYKEVETLKYRLGVAAVEVAEVQAAFDHGANEELWKPGTTLSESVVALVAENARLTKELVGAKKMLRQTCEDWAEDHTHAQTVAKSLGVPTAKVEGDSYGVPDIRELIDMVAEQVKSENKVSERENFIRQIFGILNLPPGDMGALENLAAEYMELKKQNETNSSL